MDNPKFKKVLAIDVKPYRWAVWCVIPYRNERNRYGEPFANPIVYRRWKEDGSEILFGLDSHNTLSVLPDKLLELVPYESEYVTEEFLAERDPRRRANNEHSPQRKK